MKLIATIYIAIEEIHPSNAWQLHTIHAQRGAWLLGFIKPGTLYIAMFQNQYYIQGLFGEYMVICQICQCFPPPKFPSIR